MEHRQGARGYAARLTLWHGSDHRLKVARFRTMQAERSPAGAQVLDKTLKDHEARKQGGWFSSLFGRR